MYNKSDVYKSNYYSSPRDKHTTYARDTFIPQRDILKGQYARDKHDGKYARDTFVSQRDLMEMASIAHTLDIELLEQWDGSYKNLIELSEQQKNLENK